MKSNNSQLPALLLTRGFYNLFLLCGVVQAPREVAWLLTPDLCLPLVSLRASSFISSLPHFPIYKIGIVLPSWGFCETKFTCLNEQNSAWHVHVLSDVQLLALKFSDIRKQQQWTQKTCVHILAWFYTNMTSHVSETTSLYNRELQYLSLWLQLS